MKNIFILLTVVSLWPVHAQLKTTIGVLQRINIYSNKIDVMDTVDSWNNKQAGSESMRNQKFHSENYLSVFDYEGCNYLAKSTYDYDASYSYFGEHYVLSLICKSKQLFTGIVNYYGFTDVVNPPAFPSGIKFTNTETGKWIQYGIVRSIFLRPGKPNYYVQLPDSSKYKSMVHIAGKVKDKYLIATMKLDMSVDYYLDDFNQSPSLNLGQRVYMVTDEYKHEWSPSKIEMLDDSLCLVGVTNYSNAYIMKLIGNRFTMIKKLEFPQNKEWWFKNGSVFYLEGDALMKMIYNPVTKEFSRKIVVLSNLSGRVNYDMENSILVKTFNDTLFVYNTEEQKIINKISLTKLTFSYFQSLSVPYVYMQRVDNITDIERASDKIQTVISYKIQAASNVTLKVYDLLGREVAILVDEYKQAGNYKVQFSVETLHPAAAGQVATSIPSGVYFYTLRTGGYTITKKMILMK
jgi:hypothetical protein